VGGLATTSLGRAQSPGSAPPPSLRPPDETTGVDAIAQTLIAVFDRVDILALGETHGRFGIDSDLRIAMVRHPDFAKKVRYAVIECGSATEQPALDRYIGGENVPRVQLERVWKATAETTNGFCDAPEYASFLAAVRDVNSTLPAEARIRVLGGHPGPNASRGIETAAVSVLKDQVIQKHGKALVIYGEAHFYRTLPRAMLASMGGDIGLAVRLESEFPGRTFVVIPIGPLDRPRAITADLDPDFHKFDRALKTQARPVLISLQRLPFRDFTAEEFLGRTMTSCGGRACVSAFKGSALALGQIADACVYIGGRTEASHEAKRSRY